MPTVRKFTDLECWQLANDLEKKVFIHLSEGSLAKDLSLKDQINRSVGSVPDNIAEGFGRGGKPEFIHFLTIARASCSELQSQLIRCVNRNHFSKEIYNDLFELADKTGNKIGAFIRYLNQSEIAGPKFQNRVPVSKTSINEQRTTNNKKQETIHAANAAKPLGAYPHARKVGNLLFLSGIGSRSAADNAIPGLEIDSEGNIIRYDIEAECHQCFANVKAVLEASGSSWNNIVDVTVFLTNMKKDFPVYNKVYAEYFTTVQACRTTVEVKSLPTPIAIELKVIATID